MARKCFQFLMLMGYIFFFLPCGFCGTIYIRVIFDPNTGVVEEATPETYIEDVYVKPVD